MVYHVRIGDGAHYLLRNTGEHEDQTQTGTFSRVYQPLWERWMQGSLLAATFTWLPNSGRYA